MMRVNMLIPLTVATLTALASAATAPLAAPNGALESTEKHVYRGLLMEMTGDDRTPVRVWNSAGKPVLEPYYAFGKKGLVLVDRDYALRLEGGRFFSSGTEEYLSGGLHRADGELTLSAYIQPASLSGDSGCILGYGPARGDLLFALMQEKDTLTFSINAPAHSSFKFSALKTTDPFHLIVTVGKDGIAYYVNGEKKGADAGIKCDFSAWRESFLSFGNDMASAHPWRGHIERFSLYNKALSLDDARKTAQAVLDDMAKRTPVPRIELEGTLFATSKCPMPWDEGFTYREVLSVCEYKVNKVIRGEFKEDKIRIAEWIYVDRIFLTNSSRKIGTTHKLLVEPIDRSPQLSTVERSNTLELDLDATVYYDLDPLEALPENEQPKQNKAK